MDKKAERIVGRAERRVDQAFGGEFLDLKALSGPKWGWSPLSSSTKLSAKAADGKSKSAAVFKLKQSFASAYGKNRFSQKRMNIARHRACGPADQI